MSECGESSASCTALNSWLGRPVDGFKLHEARWLSDHCRQTSIWRQKKKLIKGLVIGRFRFFALCSPLHHLLGYHVGGIILCEKWGWEMEDQEIRVKRTRTRTRSRNLDVLARGRWQSADASHAAVSD